jgi:2'-5' RNA ligase
MRLFISIDLPDELKEKIVAIINEIKKLNVIDGNFTKPAQLHLTLKFLGETSREKVDKIKTTLEEIAARTSKFNIILQGLGHFDHKILWAGGPDNNDLKNLAYIIDSELSKLGFEKETREFAIHLTLARVRYWKDKTKFSELLEKYSSEVFGKFTVRELKLMKSTLTSTGPVYEEVAEFSLL